MLSPQLTHGPSVGVRATTLPHRHPRRLLPRLPCPVPSALLILGPSPAGPISPATRGVEQSFKRRVIGGIAGRGRTSLATRAAGARGPGRGVGEGRGPRRSGPRAATRRGPGAPGQLAMTSQTLTYRSLLRELRRLLAAGLQPDPQTVADLRSLMQQFRLDFLNALDFPVSDRLESSHNWLGENHASLRASEFRRLSQADKRKTRPCSRVSLSTSAQEPGGASAPIRQGDLHQPGQDGSVGGGRAEGHCA